MRRRFTRVACLLAVVSVVTACGDEDVEQTVAGTPNRPPVISGEPSTVAIEGELYEFRPTASDPDGDEIIFHISGKPNWMTFDSETGDLHGRPDKTNRGKHRGIVISVSDGQEETTLDPLDIDVVPETLAENQPPAISGVPASGVLVGDFYDFIPTATDADGDPLSFEIENMPIWAEFDPTIGRLSGTPGLDDIGVDAGITIIVSDGIASTALDPFAIAVNAPPVGNRPPQISGQPAPSVLIGELYSFTPSASDADGDPLQFSIFGQPAWAEFDLDTGRLFGTPGPGDAGRYAAITIFVSDGAASTGLPAFSIDVESPNQAPTISGNPPSDVLVGEAYSFTPSVNDPEDDTLSFVLSGAPVWLAIDPQTGELSGTPDTEDVGSYAGIAITVSDGEADATLGPFSIVVNPVALGSATLSWTSPTLNSDGSPLTDLAGFVIYWGTSPGSYSNSVRLNNAGLTSYIVENLASGTTYYFATSAFNSRNIESGFSNEASKSIP